MVKCRVSLKREAVWRGNEADSGTQQGPFFDMKRRRRCDQNLLREDTLIQDRLHRFIKHSRTAKAANYDGHSHLVSSSVERIPVAGRACRWRTRSPFASVKSCSVTCIVDARLEPTASQNIAPELPIKISPDRSCNKNVEMIAVEEGSQVLFGFFPRYNGNTT